jgi:hypothetical protein
LAFGTGALLQQKHWVIQPAEPALAESNAELCDVNGPEYQPQPKPGNYFISMTILLPWGAARLTGVFSMIVLRYRTIGSLGIPSGAITVV